jgi:hypothetical protein
LSPATPGNLVMARRFKAFHGRGVAAAALALLAAARWAWAAGETNPVRRAAPRAAPGVGAASTPQALRSFASLAVTNLAFDRLAPVNRADRNPWDPENFSPHAITNLGWVAEQGSDPMSRIRELQRRGLPSPERGGRPAVGAP